MRPLRFVGDSLEVLRELPEDVKDEIGFALERVQRGKMPDNAKPLKGIAPGVLEIVSDFRGDTFGAVYTVRFPKSRLRFACFPEEVQTGDRDAEA
jgi:phage-related protein